MQESAQQRTRGLYREEFEHDACGIGALASLCGARSHQMLDDALSVLVNLEHRGGVGLERNTGDGAGILFQIPHRFFRREAQKCGHLLPKEGDYAVAMLFLPQDDDGVKCGMRIFEDACARCGVPLLFWREVPVDPHDLGSTARACMPTIKQAFLGRPGDVAAGQEFERALFTCRRIMEKRYHAEPAMADKIFYVCSMSSRTIVYKGMLVATQMRGFFLDLDDASTETALALVHSRYSTNTTPAWERAHPNRYIVHNGEINTLRGNVNWTRAREPRLYSPVMGAGLDDVLPIIDREGSDSAMLDNLLEFLTMNGRSLARAVSLVLPEPWDHNEALDDKRRAFDEYQSMLMEGWDGPAAVAFSDGRVTGAALDRNGLRPARYYITTDDRLLMASEVGVLDVDPKTVLSAGSLGPGQMLLVDPDAGRVVFDDEIKARFSVEKPYRAWIDRGMVELDRLAREMGAAGEPDAEGADAAAGACGGCADAGGLSLQERQMLYGMFSDDVFESIAPMAKTSAAPIASMGSDVPPACLSARPRSFFDYFNQLFAQVTNPPIDALRESCVTSTLLYVGNHANMLEDAADNCRLLKLSGPVLDRDSFEALLSIRRHGFRALRLFCAYPFESGPHALAEALERLCDEAVRAVEDGVNILVVSDRVASGEAPVPSLLALSAVHNRLLRAGLRTKTDIVVESGDAFTPHDFAALVGYSAAGVYPYLAHETLEELCARGKVELAPDEAVANYDGAIVAGIVSVMGKMGISTMQGYQGSQVFEALGLSQELVDAYFTGTVSRVGGLKVDDVQRECDERARAVLAAGAARPEKLPALGLGMWRKGGEEHLVTPKAVELLQRSVREGDFELFEDYSRELHPEGRVLQLRDLLEFCPSSDRVPLSEVEPACEIVKRFKTGAMSYGSISREAHECLAVAMNRMGAMSNSGEGGEDSARETRTGDGDCANSAIKQVASGRFGVTIRYLKSAREIQIKLAQGAKPGEGGHLPGRKVWPQIARTRRSTPGVGLISPPPHHDIYSIEDLAELIFDMKNANPDAKVSVKLVSETGVGTIATGVAKGGAHKILVSGACGGTGAAARDSIYHAGLPLELGLAETQQTLLKNGLRSRVVLEADGKLMDGRDVAIACLLGAEEFGFATAPLLAMGCRMDRVCQRDVCPVGIATQDCHLRERFSATPEHVVNYMTFVAEQLRRIMARLGVRSVGEMVGRAELLRCSSPAAISPRNWKAALVDVSPLLFCAHAEYGADIEGTSCRRHLPQMAPPDALPDTLDATLFVPYTRKAREHLVPLSFDVDISNVNRCVGTLLGSAVAGSHPEGLPEGSLSISCTGSGGMSFGAFIPRGVELSIRGDANDYFGKGLSGGVVSVAPPVSSTYRPEENVSVGNVAFYGATGGRGFVNGLAGQRFAVRNSGAQLVVEGCGNNGCEYMTGGVVVVLGEVGSNFAAGMSGGVAYVFDEERTLHGRCNKDMVKLVEPDAADLELVFSLIEEHVKRTESPLGVKLLYRFEDLGSCFVKVLPVEYERAMELTARAEARGADREQAVEQAFEEMRSGM